MENFFGVILFMIAINMIFGERGLQIVAGIFLLFYALSFFH